MGVTTTCSTEVKDANLKIHDHISGGTRSTADWWSIDRDNMATQWGSVLPLVSGALMSEIESRVVLAQRRHSSKETFPVRWHQHKQGQDMDSDVPKTKGRVVNEKMSSPFPLI
jgi:hypothetical protein